MRTTPARRRFWLEGLLLLLLAMLSETAVAATYQDCKQYGGSKLCKEPDRTPWRIGAGNVYYSGVAPRQALPYCSAIRLEALTGAPTPNAAIGKYFGVMTEQLVVDCYLDMAGITQVNNCDVLPQELMSFDVVIANRQSSPYWNKQVIALSQCDVRQMSYDYPGSYYPAPYPWRDACGTKADAVQTPTGRVLCVPQEPKKEEKDKPDCGDARGNPIDLSTGNKFEAETDYSDASKRLTFIRYYNSNMDVSSVLGRAWTTEYDARIVHMRDAVAVGGTEALLVRRGSGAQLSMAPVAADQFKAESAGPNLQVTVLRGSYGQIVGYLFRDDALVERYDANGLLTAIVAADGYTRTLSYDADQRLQTVTDTFGRVLQFAYVDNAEEKGYYLDRLITPSGAEFRYTYNQVGPNARLIKVVKPDGKSIEYVYDAAYRLVGKTDELGVRFSTFEYDANGDATVSKRAGDAGIVETSRTHNADGSFLVVINESGVQTTRQYIDINGKKVMGSQSNPAGSGCAAATATTTYDAKANPIQVDEFGGARTCRAFDGARNLPIVEVRGLSSNDACPALVALGAVLPVGAAKSSTEWHPDLRRSMRVASPRMLTTQVFNGQPDPTQGGQIASCAPAEAVLPDGKPIVVLCKAVEQATLDSNGGQGFGATLDTSVPARVTLYSYNAQGQVLTMTDGRGFTTRFGYAPSTTAQVTNGDLVSVTPPKGLATTLSAYNKDGYPLATSDSNGLSSAFQYDVLNRLKQSAIGSLVTAFTYDDKARLKQVDGPAGERAIYTYDDADRLTKIEDGSGNAMKLILDSAGNVVREEYIDPTGALKRWLERGFDALNRLSRIKGAFLPRP